MRLPDPRSEFILNDFRKRISKSIGITGQVEIVVKQFSKLAGFASVRSSGTKVCFGQYRFGTLKLALYSLLVLLMPVFRRSGIFLYC